MKYLLAFALIAILLWLLYRRLRPYLKTVRQFIHLVKGTLNATVQPQPESCRESAENKLVRCATCDTWIPLSRTLNSNAASYCSRACLDQAVKVGRRKAAS